MFAAYTTDIQQVVDGLCRGVLGALLEPGIKVNGESYRDVVLKQMLPDIKHISGDDCFVFQQDSTPAHQAKITIEVLKKETPAFIDLQSDHQIRRT